jgi:hypothetical protein
VVLGGVILGAVARPFTLTDEEVASLPLDELALEVLLDIVANPEQSNSSASMLMAAQTYKSESRRCLKEAWSWLCANRLVANDLERQQGPDAFVITRLGWQVAEGRAPGCRPGASAVGDRPPPGDRMCAGSSEWGSTNRRASPP